MKIVEGTFAEEPAMQPGWTIIASGNKGMFVLGDDKRLTFFEKKFGNYKYMRVFTGPHSLSWSMKLVSQQATYKFDVTIQARVQVAPSDIAATVRSGVTNSREFLEDPLRRILQNAVGSVMINESAKAQKGADDALAKAGAGGEFSPFVLSSVSIKVDPDPAALEHIRKLDAAGLVRQSDAVDAEQKDSRINDIVGRAMSLEHLIAAKASATSAQEREAYDALISLHLNRDSQRLNLPIQLVEMLLKHKMLEEHQVPEVLKNYLAQVKEVTDSAALAHLLKGNSASPLPELEKKDRSSSDPIDTPTNADPEASDR